VHAGPDGSGAVFEAELPGAELALGVGTETGVDA